MDLSRVLYVAIPALFPTVVLCSVIQARRSVHDRKRRQIQLCNVLRSVLSANLLPFNGEISELVMRFSIIYRSFLTTNNSLSFVDFHSPRVPCPEIYFLRPVVIFHYSQFSPIEGLRRVFRQAMKL